MMNLSKNPRQYITTNKVAMLIIALIALFVIAHDTPYSPLAFNKSANKLAENEMFSQYLEKHSCRRYTYAWFVDYYCDNGKWNEGELFDLANHRYPNK